MKFDEYRRNTEEEQAGSLITVCLREMGLAKGWNQNKVYAAWDSISGAAQYTLSQDYKSGTLYVKISSSVVSARLFPRLKEFAALMNNYLINDPTFIKGRDDEPVKRIILQ